MEFEGVSELEQLRQQVAQNTLDIGELKRNYDSLKDDQDDLRKDFADISANYLKLENTIFRENKETRETMRGLLDKQSDLINSVLGFKESAAVRESDINRLKIESRRDIVFKVIGYVSTATVAGGLLYEVVIK